MNLLRLNIKVILIVFTILLCHGCKSEKKFTLCSDGILNELVTADYNDNEQVKQLWKDLKEKRYISESNDNKDVRIKFVNMQFFFESALSSMIKYDMIRDSIVITHAPYPSSPLRIKNIGVESLLKNSTNQNKDVATLDTVIMRHKSLHKYLSQKGKLYVVYPAQNYEVIPGFKIYQDNLDKYKKNLFDIPVTNFDNQFYGTSYLVECKNGEIMLFSIRGSQINDDTNNSWSMYYGHIKEEKLRNQYEALKNLYNKYRLKFSY